jgi:hypothetical protein
MPEDRGRGDIRNDVYLFVISNEYENRPQIDENRPQIERSFWKW